MAFLKRVLRALPMIVFSPLLTAIGIVALAVADLWWIVFGPRRRPVNIRPRTDAASIVIPNWNGRDLLEKYIPAVLTAISGSPVNEVIVVDNGSSDGSADFLRERFPEVRVLALPQNLGFGGGSNAGFRAAKNDIVVLLNSDMRVEPDFLQPLLDGFADETIFAVACQIFLSDPSKRREETGLTEMWWRDGSIRVSHREDGAVNGLYPCAYGGGGSSAFDRHKFLEIGGFSEVFAPFYLEDTDLGYMAWKRGWKVLYQPASVVWHEHRGTIGKKFSTAYIQSVLKKNFILFCWKNIHGWPRLLPHFFFTLGGGCLSVCWGDEPGRANFGGLWTAFRQLPGAMRARIRARSLATIGDTEALQRPKGAIYRDRFLPAPDPDCPRILFVAPYPICPPVHGGGVFMYETVRELARLCEVHAIILLDRACELAPHQELHEYCASAEFMVRSQSKESHFGSITPHAVQEFDIDQLRWLINRQVFQHRLSVVQLEYTALAQYAERYKTLVSAVFEHDVYFQSIARGLKFMRSPFDRLKARFEYLRAIRFELRQLRRADRVQVCTLENRNYLESFLPDMHGRIENGLRAGIATQRYAFPGGPRRSFAMLFVGSFRHPPNQIALEWFARDVLPRVVERCPAAKLLVAGSDPPPMHAYADATGAMEMLGFVEDLQPLFASCSVFVCPIRSGSGVRVKLLEAFASGIPVVSTFIGAEGLARKDGEVCRLSNDPEEFAAQIVELFDSPERAHEMASRAREEVERHWDMKTITRKLADSYRTALAEKQRG